MASYRPRTSQLAGSVTVQIKKVLVCIVISSKPCNTGHEPESLRLQQSDPIETAIKAHNSAKGYEVLEISSRAWRCLIDRPGFLDSGGVITNLNAQFVVRVNSQ